MQEAEPEAAEPAERPDHIPEQFWDPEKGETNVDAMANAYRELRKKMDSGKHKVPEKYDTSQVEALEGLDPDDPVLTDFLALAKDQGLDQGQFEELTKFYLDAQGEIADKIETSRVEEMNKLGRNADGIIKSMDAWLCVPLEQGVERQRARGNRQCVIECRVHFGHEQDPQIVE